MEEINNSWTKTNINDLIQQLEETKQELHAVNIKYNSKLAFEKEIIAEVDVLHRSIENEKENRKRDILKYEEEARKKDLIWKDEMEILKISYEEDIKSYKNKLACLEEELSQFKKGVQNEGNQLSDLKEKLNYYKEILEMESHKREEAEEAVKLLKSECEKTRGMLVAAEEKLQIKNEDIINLKEKLMSAEDDIALYSSQLQEMKAPLKNDKELSDMDPMHKGNSLFAEVDDRRQVMKQQLLSERNKYAKLKQAYQAKCSAVRYLEAQLIDVSRKWKDEASESSSTNDKLINSYKSLIKDLEEKVERLQNQSHKFAIDGEYPRRMDQDTLPEFKRIEADLLMERNEVKKLREKLESMSYERLIQDQEMFETKGKLRKVLAENAYLLRVNENLNKTEDMKNGRSFTTS